MEIKIRVRQILYVIIGFVFLINCNTHNEINNINKNEEKKQKNYYYKQEKLIKRYEDSFFQYKEDVFKLKSNNDFTINLIINNTEYNSSLSLDSSEINLLFYKQNNNKLILIEGADYYSSTFFVFHYFNDKLYFLGDFSIEFPNIEKDPNSGVVDFKVVRDNQNKLNISAYTDNKKIYFKSFEINNSLQSVLSFDQTSNFNQKEIINKWQGIYYNEPYHDSVGSYYVNIKPPYIRYGFSGIDNFDHKLSLVEKSKDSLLLYNENHSNLLGVLLKKDNKFWIKSDLIKNEVKNKDGLFLLKYAKSADDVPD